MSPPVVALLAQQLCLRKVGNPLNFGADSCCLGNEILARCGDPVAYRLVCNMSQYVQHVVNGILVVMQVRQQALEEERLKKEREDEEAKAQVFTTFYAILSTELSVY